jgi:hypothetical protein
MNKRRNKMVTFLAIVSAAVFLIIVIGVRAIMNGFVLSVLWNWFMVPIFTLPELTIISAIGLTMVISWMTYHVETRKKETEELKTFWVLFFLRPILVLSIGYIIHCFMR